MKRSLLAAALVTLGGAAWAETPTLTVYTYDSFVSDWGPGPAIEAAFEATCECDLEFVGAGDGAALLARLKLEGSRTNADVVLGLVGVSNRAYEVQPKALVEIDRKQIARAIIAPQTVHRPSPQEMIRLAQEVAHV